MWWLLLFVCACHGAPTHDTFTVSAPNGPLSVWIGSSIILPCSVSPAFTASLQVRWHRPDKYKTPVLLYENRQVQEQPADPQYKGRVSLIGQLEKGNVSLKLENVSLADSGEFVCFVAGDTWYEQASVHLIVKVMGSPPVLSVTYGGSGQVNITCVSDGWAPQPNLTWRNNGVTEIPSQNHHSATDDHGLVSVTSWLVHSSSGSEWVACSVGLPEEERKESRISPYISGADTVELERILRDKDAEMENLKQKSKGPWKEVFISGLVLLLLSSIATVLILYKKGFIKWKYSKETAAESQQEELCASGKETESLLKKQSEEKTLNQKITGLLSQLEESKREVERLNQQIKATDEDEGKKLNGKVNDIEKEHQKLKQQNEDLLKQHEEEKTLKKEVETLNQMITGLLSQLEENKREVERLNHQIKATDEDEGKKLEGKVNDIKKENQELKQQNEDLLKKQSEEEKTLKKEVGALNQKITANDEDKEKKTEGKLNDIEKENQELKQLNEGAFSQNHGLVIQVKPWKTVKRLKEILTMDEASVKGDLEVDSRRKSVKCTKPNRNETLNAMSTYILCKETFSSGQHFWEVNVNDKPSWFVGVCSNTLRGQHGVSLTPQNGCWLLCYDKHQGLFVNTDPKITSVQEENKYQFNRLGVFLDCCRHSLTFYDGVSQSCLCIICDVGPTLPLVPLFSPGERDLYEVKIMD